jgi:hypothetical protein
MRCPNLLSGTAALRNASGACWLTIAEADKASLR